MSSYQNKTKEELLTELSELSQKLKITESVNTSDISNRKLWDSNEHYHYLFKNNPQPMWIYDIESLRFLEINNAAIHHYGYSKEEFLAMTIKDIRPEEDLEALKKDIEFTHQPYNLAGEWRHLKKNGEIIFVNIISHELTINNRKARHVMVSDITELKKASEILKESHALIKIAGAKAKLGGWSVDLHTNKLLWSDEVADIHEMPHGFSPDVSEGIGFYAPEWRERITQVFAACAEREVPYDEEMEIITRNGKRKWVRTIGQAVKNEQGKIVMVQGAFQDITEKKQDQLKLVESESRYSRLINNASDLIYRYELWPERRFSFVSPSSTNLCGYTPDEHYNNPNLGFHFVYPEDKHLLAEMLNNGLQHPKKIVLRWIHKHGHLIWTEQSNVPVFNEAGRLIAIEGIARDITQEKSWNEEREHIHRLFKEVQSFTKTGAWEYDTTEGKWIWTRQIYNILELDVDTEIKNIFQLKSCFTDSGYSELVEAFNQCLENNTPIDLLLTFRTGQKKDKWISLIGHKMESDDKIMRIIGSISDVTDWKEQQIKLEGRKEILRKIYRTMFEKIEEERKRLANEVHDELGQILTVINLDLAIFKDNTRSRQNIALIKQTQAAVQEAVSMVRRIASDLRPSLLDQLGLIPAIEWLVREMAKRTHCSYSVNLPDKAIFQTDQAVIINIYRIVQESLTNIARHAKATHIEVIGNITSNNFTLAISDNGSGFADLNYSSKTGLGIQGMYERAEMIQAILIIKPVNPQGTCINLSVPITLNKML